MLDPHALLLQHFDERLVSGSVVEASTGFVWMRIWHSKEADCWMGTLQYVPMWEPVREWTSGSSDPLQLARGLLAELRAFDSLSKPAAEAFATHLGLKEPQ